MFTNSRVKSALPLSTILTVLVFAILTTPPALAGDWKGQTEQRDGVEYVMNPMEGMESPVTLELDELWRIGGDTDDEDEFFGIISRITTDPDGNIYLLDSQLNEVKVFSPDGAFLRTMGREGEGPGEFRGPADMFFLPDGNLGVLQVAPGRIVMLTPDGEPVGDYPLPQDESGATPILVGGQLMGDNLLLVLQENNFQEGKLDITRCLAVIDSEGNETKRLHEDIRPIEFANAVFDEKVWRTFDGRWAVSPGGALHACTQFPDYEVEVWDARGNKTRVVSREFNRRKRDEEEMERMHDIFEAFTRQVPNAQIKVSDFDPDIAGVFPRADGSLWVQNSRGAEDMPDGSLGIFDVFNEDGHFVREVTLMGEGDPTLDGYFFVDDRLYVVTGFLEAAMAQASGGAAESEVDEDAEPMAVICYQVGPLKAGM
jgi:sugar lactone lactonase YvrE